MKLAFSTLACVDWDLPKIVGLAAEWGYDGVELRVAGDQYLNPSLTREEREKVRRLFSRHGLAIPCLAAYTRFAFPEREKQEENIDALKQVIDLAHDLEAPYVRTFGANTKEQLAKESLVEWVAEALAAVDDYASRRGVRVLLETHDLLSTGSDLQQIFTRTGPVTAGVLWDVKHSLVKGEAVRTTLDLVGDLVCHVHLKDWLTVPGLERERLVLLGAGDLPLAVILACLKEIDYQGFLSLEWEKLWHPGIEDSYVAIYQFVHKLKGQIE